MIFEILNGVERSAFVREVVSVDAVEELVSVLPVRVSCISNAHDKGVVLFSKFVNVRVEFPIRVDKSRDRCLEFFF